MHVSNRRYSRSRMLAWCAGLVALCAQASSFFSCSFGTAGSLPILPPPSPPTPMVSITVVPATITLGQSALLSWSASGVSACTASGAWSGPQNPSGSTKVTPATTGTFAYVLNCSVASGGSIAQSATLTASAPGSVSSARRIAFPVGGIRVRRTDLVADIPRAGALAVDPTLAEPWGLVLSAGQPAVAASRTSGASSSYDGVGRAQPGADPLRLQLPFGTEGTGGGVGSVVANSTDGFVVSVAGKSAPARLLYASTNGLIAAWSPEVDMRRAVVVHAASDSAAYTALAIAASSSPSERWLYAADFRNARIEVFDSSFRSQASSPTSFAFTDPTLPAGYAPFGIAALDGLIYVAYAQRPVPFTADPVTGPGLGLVDVFTASGDFVTRLISGGVLNAPWALVAAPGGGALPFGRVLLVGNSGDGTIDAFEPETGALVGRLGDERGEVLVIPHLHGLAFGNDYAEQPRTTLFFTAGPSGAAQGWYARLDFLDSPEPAR